MTRLCTTQTRFCGLNARWDNSLIVCTLAMCSFLMTGCDARSQSTKAAAPRSPDVKEFREFDLTIYGYNYTDTEIGSFEVDGRGGGNLAVSSRDTGGSKSVCCAALYTPLPVDNKIRIKWSRDGDIWCEQDVPFHGPVPSDSEYLEVHLYRDGHIEIATTAEPSPPRLKLDRLHGNSRHSSPELNVNNDSKFSRCARGYR